MRVRGDRPASPPTTSTPRGSWVRVRVMGEGEGGSTWHNAVLKMILYVENMCEMRYARDQIICH